MMDRATIKRDWTRLVPLCAEHLDVEHAITAMGLDQQVGDSWQS